MEKMADFYGYKEIPENHKMLLIIMSYVEQIEIINLKINNCERNMRWFGESEIFKRYKEMNNAELSKLKEDKKNLYNELGNYETLLREIMENQEQQKQPNN